MQLITNEITTLYFSFSTEFNERLKELINSQFDGWTKFCSQPATYELNNLLPYIKSIYLIADVGVEKY